MEDIIWITYKGRRIPIKPGMKGKLKKKEEKELNKKGKEQEEYKLYKQAKEKPDSIDPMTENSTDWEALDKKYSKRYNEETENNNEPFIQHNTMYGGTREYTKEQVDRMAEHGTKPMKESYTGYGWEGTKYDSNLTTKEIAKNITDYSKKEFPDVKLARKTDYNGVDIHIMSSDKDMYLSDKDIDAMSNKQLLDLTNNYGNGMFFDRWARDNVPSFNEKHTFTEDDIRRYMKEDLKALRNRSEVSVSGNEYFLSDYGKKVVSGLNKEMNSYNYDDSDGMIDYFNTNFYGYVHIGKWNKPYEVNSKKISSGIKFNTLSDYEQYFISQGYNKATALKYAKQEIAKRKNK